MPSYCVSFGQRVRENTFVAARIEASLQHWNFPILLLPRPQSLRCLFPTPGECDGDLCGSQVGQKLEDAVDCLRVRYVSFNI